MNVGLEKFKLLLNLSNLMSCQEIHIEGNEEGEAEIKLEFNSPGFNSPGDQEEYVSTHDQDLEWEPELTDSRDAFNQNSDDDGDYLSKDEKDYTPPKKKPKRQFIPCPLCSVKCTTTRGLIRHTRRMHQSESRNY